MRRLLASLAVLSVVSLTACGGGAASSGVNGSKANPTAEVNAARAEAEAQERKLSDLRQQKADLEAQLEGNAAPAASTPAPAPVAAKADAPKPTVAPSAAPAQTKPAAAPSKTSK